MSDITEIEGDKLCEIHHVVVDDHIHSTILQNAMELGGLQIHHTTSGLDCPLHMNPLEHQDEIVWSDCGVENTLRINNGNIN